MQGWLRAVAIGLAASFVVSCSALVGPLSGSGSSGGSGGTSPTYTVTYNGNGNTGGAVPVDSNKYQKGQTVTMLGNTGNLVRTGYSFIGWNTAADGSGATYAPGTTFTMGSANVVLYALWTQSPTYTVTYNGNGNTGGMAPVDNNRYETAQTVTVAGNTGNLVKSGYAFSDWNTAADGSGATYQTGATFVMGTANVTIYAQWAAVYTVTYSGNGNTGGIVPVDTNQYQPGQAVTVLSNVGLLVNSGHAFDGWNTKADGSGTAYPAGTTFNMGNANATLHAQWGLPNVYVTTGSNSVSAFTIGSGGTLTPIAGTFSTGSYPLGIAISPNGSFLYVTNPNGGTVTEFSIGSGGTLTPVQTIGTPFSTATPVGIAISPNGSYLYVTDNSNRVVWISPIGPSGGLSSYFQYSISTGLGPVGIAISPNNGYLYVTNSDNTISAFSIGSGGLLTAIGAFSVGSAPGGITISPNGQFLYVADDVSSTISAFSIAGGAPTAIGTYSTGLNPYAIAISPNGTYLYTANRTDYTVSAFSVSSNGTLSPISGSPFAVGFGSFPEGIAISPSGEFLYTANNGNSTVSAFTINSDGSITPISGTFSTGSAPVGIAIAP